MRPPRPGPENPPRRASKAVVARLSLYLRQLEWCQRQNQATISSSTLAKLLNLSDAQVRKDLASFGHFGTPGIGYPTADLIGEIRRILGIDRPWLVALIGFGNLGQALSRHQGFLAGDFQIVALFDNDPRKLGSREQGLVIQPLDQLASTRADRSIELAILCVPAESAQDVAHAVVAAGFHGILNFAPTALNVEGIQVVDVDLTTYLEQLTYKVQRPRASAQASTDPQTDS